MNAPIPQRDGREPGLQEREIEFFSHAYRNQAYNLTGWRLRMERDLHLARREAPGGRFGRVLSIGCGDGRFELMVARHADRVTALDISPQAIDAARRNAREEGVGNAEFRCGTIRDLELGEPFDAVMCIGFLHHVPEAELPGFLRAACALLRPGGFFYSQDPNVHGIVRRIGRRVLGDRYDTYHTDDERELDPDETRASMSEAGFASVRLFSLDLTLIPATFFLVRAPGWALVLCDRVDRLFNRLRLPRLASSFAIAAEKPIAP